jgi:hypothetical protein
MKSKKLLAAAVAVAMLVPCVASAQQTGQQQKENPNYTGPNRALLDGGAVAFGVPYATSIVVAASTPGSAENNLYIPVVGPWINLGSRTCSSTDPCASEGLTGTLLVVDGLLQGLGVLAIGASFVIPESKAAPPTIQIGDSGHMTVAPSKLGKDGYGLSAVGQF